MGLSIIVQGWVSGKRVLFPQGTGGACLLRRECGGVRKALRVHPATICPWAVPKGSAGPAWALISSKLLFA